MILNTNKFHVILLIRYQVILLIVIGLCG